MRLFSNQPLFSRSALGLIGMLVLPGAPLWGQEALEKTPGQEEARPAAHSWKTIPLAPGQLPWAIFDPETHTLDGKNLTPGFEAMATRFGKVSLRFEERNGTVVLALNKRPVRYQPNEWVELGNRGHFAYVRAADDRFLLRVGLITDWLKKNRQRGELLLGKEAMTEFQVLYAKNDTQTKLGKARKNEQAELDLDYFLFQFLEGRPALTPVPGGKTTLANFWETELWSHQTAKARFNPNLNRDKEFIEFHCQKFLGAEGSPFRGQHRNPPPSQLGDPDISDK